MRVFDHPNLSSDWRCPICGEATDTPVTLISIDGTEEGNIVEARQYHVECLELSSKEFIGGGTIIYMNYGGE